MILELTYKINFNSAFDWGNRYFSLPKTFLIIDYKIGDFWNVLPNEIRPKNNDIGLFNFIGRKTVFFFECFDKMRNTFIAYL